jgi:hypothetical protein
MAEDELEEVEYQGGSGRAYGFRSKVTDMAQGKADLQKQNKKKKQKQFKLHPSKKPGIAKMVPKPIQVARENAARNIIGIPNGIDGFRPISFFKKDNEPMERDALFGGIKRDKSGKIKLF